MTSGNTFLGFDKFVWFQGVVEDRFDPLKLGRLRVRILGIHTEDKTKIPTQDLPWAYPIMPITSASMNGIGEAPLGPVEGTWVIGFFRDGDSCQEPVVFGTIGGIPQKRDNGTTIGFSDPYNHYPETDYIKEPDTNRLARGENISETIVELRKQSLAMSGQKINVALETVSNNGGSREEGDDTGWLEPLPAYNATYPFNKVYQSERGITKEIDDTKDHRRIHEYHPGGTFYEIWEEKIDDTNSRAHKLTKINGKNYTIVLDDDNIFVEGSVNITARGRVNVYSGNDINVEANEKLTIHAKKNTSIFCAENITIDAAKDIVIKSGGDLTINSKNVRASSVNNINLNSELGSIALISNTTMGLSSIGDMNITSTTANTKMYSLINTSISSGSETLLDGLTTIVQSDVKTSLLSKGSTNITSGNGLLTLDSKTSLINVKSKISINLEAPFVSRRNPNNKLPGPLTFNP